MLLTEEQAREKWCPFEKTRPKQDAHERYTKSRCIASDCMAWQWGDVVLKDTVEGSGTATLHVGYCGLAGKAET